MTRERMGNRMDSATERRLFQALKPDATSNSWLAAADAIYHHTLAASLSAKVGTIAFTGLSIGDEIIGYHLLGQIESAGNVATLDCQLRRLTVAAADLTDAALVGTDMTQISVTADSVINESNAKKEFAASSRIIVAENMSYYAKLTGTTNASTDIDFMGIVLYINRNR